MKRKGDFHSVEKSLFSFCFVVLNSALEKRMILDLFLETLYSNLIES